MCFIFNLISQGESPWHNKVLDYTLKVNEFKLQLGSYAHFQTNILGKGIELPYPLSYGLNSISAVLLQNAWTVVAN